MNPLVAGPRGHPTLFGLSVRGHDVTLHFLVNDVLMALFFGLAVKEIAEAFQPGGSLYPPGRKAVNPLCGTLGGVLGPILAYFVILKVGVALGLLDALDRVAGLGVRPPLVPDVALPPGEPGEPAGGPERVVAAEVRGEVGDHRRIHTKGDGAQSRDTKSRLQ